MNSENQMAAEAGEIKSLSNPGNPAWHTLLIYAETAVTRFGNVALSSNNNSSLPKSELTPSLCSSGPLSKFSIEQDAKILVFPLRSMKGIFAWATSREVLSQFFSDASDLKFTWDLPSCEANQALVTNHSICVDREQVMLEEFAFQAIKNDGVQKIAEWFSARVFPADPNFNWWRSKLSRDLVILSESSFNELLFSSIELERRNITQDISEYYPGESVFYTRVSQKSPENEVMRDVELLSNIGDQIYFVGNEIDCGKGILRVFMPKFAIGASPALVEVPSE